MRHVAHVRSCRSPSTCPVCMQTGGTGAALHTGGSRSGLRCSSRHRHWAAGAGNAWGFPRLNRRGTQRRLHAEECPMLPARDTRLQESRARPAVPWGLALCAWKPLGQWSTAATGASEQTEPGPHRRQPAQRTRKGARRRVRGRTVNSQRRREKGAEPHPH